MMLLINNLALWQALELYTFSDICQEIKLSSKIAIQKCLKSAILTMFNINNWLNMVKTMKKMIKKALMAYFEAYKKLAMTTGGYYYRWE